MKIAILGATSQIAKDLIISFSEKSDDEIVMFSRSPERVIEQFNVLGKDVRYENLDYSEFNFSRHYDVIINFVGIGDPSAALKLGEKIFEITEHYDNLAIAYIKENPSCKYIFISSGAVFGGNFEKPVSQETVSTININNLHSSEWYGVAKLYAEAKHRALKDFSIVDVRVFNYFSHTQDMNARFLITDIVRAIKNKEVLKTSPVSITRDFVTSLYFFRLIESIIKQPKINQPIDCCSKAPIEKFNLLEECAKKFGLKYELIDGAGFSATGAKQNYYSVRNLEYALDLTSSEAVISEIDIYLGKLGSE